MGVCVSFLCTHRRLAARAHHTGPGRCCCGGGGGGGGVGGRTGAPLPIFQPGAETRLKEKSDSSAGDSHRKISECFSPCVRALTQPLRSQSCTLLRLMWCTTPTTGCALLKGPVQGVLPPTKSALQRRHLRETMAFQRAAAYLLLL